jgi:hypothetical protein
VFSVSLLTPIASFDSQAPNANKSKKAIFFKIFYGGIFLANIR